MPDPARRPLPFLGGRLPAWAHQVTRVIPVGEELAYEPGEWQDALVIVEAGSIVLAGISGTEHTAGTGDILWLADQPLRALVNPGLCPAVLVSVARRFRGPPEGLV